MRWWRDRAVAKGKLVWQDADGIWLAPPLAAQRSGLTKPELARRALAGELAFKDDKFGRPRWYAETEITKLASELAQRESVKVARPKRQPTASQLEAQYARQAAELPQSSSQGRGGPVTAHYERVMIKEIFANAAKKNSD